MRRGGAAVQVHAFARATLIKSSFFANQWSR
jgi:hypothetical protein